MNSEHINSKLGLQAKTHWTVGEPRKTPKGTLLDGVRQESYCAFEMGEGDDGELALCLERAVTLLSKHRDFLRRINASGGMAEFFITWEPAGDTGQTFDADLIGAMADLRISLGINVV